MSRVLHPNGRISFKRIEYLRFPLRLGNDVFKHQHISAESEDKLIRLLHVFKLLIELYGVDDYMICATSAFREAQNKGKVVKRIQEKLGISIDVVDGEQEGILIGKAIQYLLSDQKYLHVDVGGGSTEVGFYVGQEKIIKKLSILR